MLWDEIPGQMKSEYQDAFDSSGPGIPTNRLGSWVFGAGRGHSGMWCVHAWTIALVPRC